MRKQEEFVDELKSLCEKYNINNIVFGGDVNDKFWGFFGLTAVSINELVGIVSNAARLYQAAREKIMNRFDMMARQ